MRFILLCAIFILTLNAGQAKALQIPKSIATDHRIKIVRYNPNEVYRFIGHYGYQSIIEFGSNEEIKTVSIGDSIAWQVNPVKSRLFLKPVEQDALTNMTVITDRGAYHFELHAQETDNIRDRDMIFVLRFIYPESAAAGFASHVESSAIPDLEDPEIVAKLNLDYSITGSEAISPIRIFDDGEFTYFQFKDKNANIPAFFNVDALGNESIINFRTVDDYIIVERVSPRFTLRNGSNVLCVSNEKMNFPKIANPEKEGIFSNLKFWFM